MPKQAKVKSRFLLPIAVAGVGVATIATGWVWASNNGVTILSLTEQLITATEASAYAPLVYTVGAIVLPLFFFPQTIVVAASGLLFDFKLGLFLAMTAQAAGALLAYGLGWQLRAWRNQERPLPSRIEPYTQWLKERPFESVTIMRFFNLPNEIVSYACGWLQIGWQPFLAGTVLGIFPGVLFLTALGSTVRDGVLVTAISPIALIVSGGVVVGSFLVAYSLHQPNLSASAK